MKKFFFETESHFQKRRDLDQAAKQVAGKKLWRVTAIEMKSMPDSMGGGYQMGVKDHFTVSACSREMAIGAFCVERGMGWFVIAADEESVIGA